MENVRFIKVTRGDRIDSVVLSPEEEAGAREVMDDALPKCSGWPAYGQIGEAALGGAQIYNFVLEEEREAPHDLRLASYAEDIDHAGVA